MERIKELKHKLDLFKESIEQLTDIPALKSNYNKLVYVPAIELLKELGYSEEEKHNHVQLDLEGNAN